MEVGGGCKITLKSHFKFYITFLLHLKKLYDFQGGLSVLNFNLSIFILLFRSRSRSPTDSKRRLPDELKQHLQFTLIDTDGMSESQLREIPYKVVETDAAKAIRVKLSPTNKRIAVQARRHRR